MKKKLVSQNNSPDIDEKSHPNGFAGALSRIVYLNLLLIKAIHTAVVTGSFSAAALTGQIVLAVSMLLITAIMGRFFCGFLCAFGTMGDFFWYIGTQLKLRRPKIGTKADRMLKKVKYVPVIGIILFGWTFGMELLSGTDNLDSRAGMLAKPESWTDYVRTLLRRHGAAAGAHYCGLAVH